MSILWWVLIALFLCLGFLGCFVSKVPGPIAVFLATLVAKLCLDMPFEWYVVGITAGLAIASMILSKVLVKLVKKLHEYSKRATWGTIIGSIIGLGILVGVKSIDSAAFVILIAIVALVLVPFVLAFLLELTNKKGAMCALKSAASATAAYLADTCLKLAVFIYAIYAIFEF
ncbi:MAG: DUF456 family protein [Paludibacteraceae bacterium]